MSTHNACLPGEPTHSGTTMVETATTAIQSFAPINKIHQHLCGVHFYGHDMTRQVEAHHYCAHQNEEMRQCLIYDSAEKDARLIGIEYVISENLFMLLPDTEKPMWHSHEYEVKSGVLFMPGVPGPIERQDMDKLARTYGKLIYFWQVDRGDTLPLGLPQLMMAFTRDYQLYTDLQTDVEKRYHLSFTKESHNRKDIKGCEHGVHPLANGGGAGKGLLTVLRETEYCKPTDLVPTLFI